MSLFRAFLVAVIAVIGGYTAIVIKNHGLFSLLPTFFGDMSQLSWPGQFNLDFMFMLAFSALWLAWRNHFSGKGLALAVGGFFLGAPYLAVYLLYASSVANGDMAEVLLGKQRALALRGRA